MRIQTGVYTAKIHYTTAQTQALRLLAYIYIQYSKLWKTFWMNFYMFCDLHASKFKQPRGFLHVLDYAHIFTGKHTWVFMCVRLIVPWHVLYAPLCPLVFNLAKRITSVLSSNEHHSQAYVFTQPYLSPLSSPLLWPSLNVRLTLWIYRVDKTWMYHLPERQKKNSDLYIGWIGRINDWNQNETFINSDRCLTSITDTTQFCRPKMFKSFTCQSLRVYWWRWITVIKVDL